MPVPPLMQQLTTAVLVLDTGLTVRYANAAAETLFSGSSRRLHAAPLESLLRYCSFDLELLRQLAVNQQTLTDSDVTLVFHDGKSATVELTASPAALDDTPEAVLLEMQRVDMIRRINQEQVQQHQLEAAQKLVRGLAHEIKNPLGGIRGAAQLLSHELEKDDHKEYTQLIMDQSDRLRNLVDRLLGPNKFSQRDWHNVHEVLERAIDVIELDKPDQVQIGKDYDPSLPDIHVSSEQIEQVMLNLLSNAVRSAAEPLDARQDTAKVMVRTRVSHQEVIYGKRYKQCAIITVQDNGPGVPADLKDTLFYPLVTGHEGGSGLGLSIAQSLVHQHAGKIELNSRPGNTEFSVYLPYGDPA